jgi:RND family efflux transporter MFP subunit
MMKKNRVKETISGIKDAGRKGLSGMAGMAKKKKMVLIAGIIIAVAVLGVILLKPKEPELNLYEAKKTDLAQEVSLTGKVKAAESVSLSFERAGRISSFYAVSGKRIYAGEILASLNNSGLEADLAKAEAELGNVLSGARPEEINVQKAVVENSKLIFEVAENDLLDKLADNKGKVGETIANKMDRFFSSPKTAPNLNFGISDYALESRIESEKAALESKMSAWNLAVGASDGAYAAMEALTAIRSLSDSLLLAFGENIVTGYSQSTVDGWETDTISVRSFASTAASAITVAREKYVSGGNSLAVAEKDLALMLSGATSFQIESARAAVDSVKAEISKGIIRSPISGMIGKTDAVKGETVSAGAPVITVISDKRFQIEAYVPEADIAKIKTGNPAKVTLDAYGSDTVFQASVVSIDPGETIVEGVTSYKAIIEFDEDDERVKSGMTANADVMGGVKEGVVAVPQRAVITDDGRKFLNVLKEGNITRVEVKTGFRGSDGYVEIIEGLSEGEKVVVSLPK